MAGGLAGAAVFAAAILRGLTGFGLAMAAVPLLTLLALPPDVVPGLRRWGMQVAQRRGMRRAQIAVARRFAVIQHRLWTDETEFQVSRAGIGGAAAASELKD